MSQLTPTTAKLGAAWREAALITLAALAVRGGVATMRFDALADDPDHYRQLAENWVKHGVLGQGELPTAYRPPLYPALLAALLQCGATGQGAIAVLHVVLGVGGALATYCAGRLLGLGRLSVAAALLVACDPILLEQSTRVMTETLATLLTAIALASLAWTTNDNASAGFRGAIVAGMTLGLAILCRPTFVAWAALALPAIVWLARPRWRGAAPALAAFAVIVVVVFPWAIRNARALGRPIITTTHGGYTLWLANNEDFYAHRRDHPGAVWTSAEFDRRVAAERAARPSDSELDHDRRETAAALAVIRARPAMFARAAGYRVARLWGLLPRRLPGADEQRSSFARWAVAAWYAGELLLAALGAWSLGRRWGDSPWLFALLLAASFTAVHALYWTDMRMRAPLAPAIALAAAAGAGWALQRFGAWRSRASR